MESKSLNISEVARQLGVSRATVSLAFSGKGTLTPQRREAVRSAAMEMGYSPNPLAQRLSQGRALKTVALFSPALDASVTIHRIQHIQRLLNDRGFEVELHARPYQRANTEDSCAILRSIRQSKPRALFVNAAWDFTAQDQEEVRAFASEGGLVVVLSYNGPVALPFDQSVQDETHSVAIAVQHLVELGHRDIGISGHSIEEPSNGILRAFEREMRRAKLPMCPELVLSAPDLYYETMGQSIAAQFLALPRKPTAMVVGVDRMCLMFVHALFRAGVQIPRDLSVVCLGDSPLLESAIVPLTTTSHPYRQHGDLAVDLLMRQLASHVSLPPTVETVRGELIVRESSSPLGA